ncbi:MAG: hypothetical protein V1722_05645 [Candidatus Micrarchaeota archaeon]
MKGQIFGIDILIAILLFAGVWSTLTAILGDVQTQQDDFDLLSLQVNRISAQLLSSSGTPTTWTPSTVSQLGLVVQKGVIEKDKLGNFLNVSTNLTRTRDLLGISNSPFYINVSYVNGTTVYVNSTNYNGTAIVGIDFSSTPAVVSKSLAVYQNNRVFLIIKIGGAGNS